MAKWEPTFETSIKAVDEQHQELFRQIDLLQDKANKVRAGEMLDFLEDYVVKHFGTEELMQKVSKYPLAEQHKKLHEDFIVTFLELKREYESSGENMLILMKIMKVATEWLKFHIMGHDKEFGDYFKENYPDGRGFAE